MSIKRVSIIGVFFIFLISFITHSMYDWNPNIITFMFFPVNESIWEHQKMIFSSYLIWGVVQYYILVKNHLFSKNALFSTVASAVFNIGLFLIVYVPIYKAYGHDLIVTLIIYFITIMISQYINYIILDTDTYYRKLNRLSLALIPIIWMIFIYLSYNPPPNNLLFLVP